MAGHGVALLCVCITKPACTEGVTNRGGVCLTNCDQPLSARPYGYPQNCRPGSVLYSLPKPESQAACLQVAYKQLVTWPATPYMKDGENANLGWRNPKMPCPSGGECVCLRAPFGWGGAMGWGMSSRALDSTIPP
ncbi:hypothetical protein BX600DRAFT_284373 [Xylariales sp. PMI_506]|nr:hypothetical protein BX600DRAFT_284373 [Xylariales sp. PMI_506]